jgi:cell division protein FtsZ
MDQLFEVRPYGIEQEHIEEYAHVAKPMVSVVGLGGAGCNIVSWIKERGIVGGKLLALNTDANHLSGCKADRRILIGEKIASGMGCGGYPRKGEKAMRENLKDVVRELDGSGIAFIVAGLGGGTGTGASHVLAERLHKETQLVIGVVTLPFSVEKVRMDNARVGLNQLRRFCDTVVVIDNDKLVRVAGNLSFQEGLGVANELIGIFVKDITETITTASLINLDFMDLKSITKRGGIAAIGSGYGQGEDRVDMAVRKALRGQLLDIENVTKAYGALIHVSGGESMTLQEVFDAGDLVKNAVSNKTKIVWGAKVDQAMADTAHVFVALTDVESTFLSKKKRFGIF